MERLKKQEAEVLAQHKNRLAALEKLLSEGQKERIKKIEQLVAGLNEEEAEYVRYRLLANVEF